MSIFNFSKKDFEDSINVKSHLILSKEIRNLSQMLKIMEKKEYEQRIKNKELRIKLKKAENQIENLLKKEKNQMKILCLYDKKAEKFATPFTAINNAVATRDFSRACAEPNSAMAQFPDDIELCYLGDFDEITGRIIPLKEIATIATAKEYCTNGKGNDKPNNPNNN